MCVFDSATIYNFEASIKPTVRINLLRKIGLYCNLTIYMKKANQC